MKNKIGSLQKYIEVYGCIGDAFLTRKELTEKLLEKNSKSVTAGKVKDAFDGKIPWILIQGEKVGLDINAYRNFLEELSKEFGTTAATLFTGPAPAPKGKKEDDPQSKTIPNKVENPQVKSLRDQVQKLKNEKANLEKAIAEQAGDAILEKMEEKVVVLSSMQVRGKAVEEDIFLYNPALYVDKPSVISKERGKKESYYQNDNDSSHGLSVKDARNRLCEAILRSRIFEKMFRDEQIATPKMIPARLSDRDAITEDDIRKNRRKSIELLLEDRHLSNQTKLSFYAAWHEYHGTELEDLLNYAGDHGLDANYVIRLLERPDAFNNYENVRGFLRQACKASEARARREAAKELIAGEWYVIAEYDGKPCRFQMLPMTELLAFRKALRDRMYPQAEVEKMLGTYRKTAFVDEDPDKKLIVKSVGYEDLDDEYLAKASAMIHQYEVESGVNVHEPVPAEADLISVDFKDFEQEVPDGGKEQ